MFFEMKSLAVRPGYKLRFHLYVIQEDIPGLRLENGGWLSYFDGITVCNNSNKCTTKVSGNIISNSILLRGGNTCFKSCKYKTE
jgi:hypothetical protein